MGRSYVELTVDGHFVLVKGFLMGFWSSRDPQPDYFFHRNTGIHHESFKDVLKDLLELEDEVRFCLEESAVPAFQEAVARAESLIGISITSHQRVKHASFEFSVEVFSREMGKTCKALFEDPPEGLDLKGFDPKEEIDEEARNDPYLHAYTYSGKGRAEGDFEAVKTLYLGCKRSEASDFIRTQDIRLTYST